MAGYQEQPQSGQTQELVELLRRRKWQILLPMLFMVSLGVAWAEIVPRKYDVRTMIELRQMVLPVMGQNMDPDVINRDVRNASIQLNAKARINAVLTDLQWDDFMAITDRQIRSEYINRIRKNIRVNFAGGGKDNPSAFLTIGFADTNPERAEQFLNRLRDIYIEDVVERVRNRAREERDKLQDLVQEKELEYQTSERELAELKRQYQLSVTQPAPGRGVPRDEEPIFVQLTQAQSQLENAVRDLEVQQALVESLRERYKAEPEQTQEVRREDAISVRKDIAQIDKDIIKQKRLQEGIRPAHSRWKKAQAEIERLEALRRDLEDQTLSGAVAVEYTENKERARLRVQISEAETEIARLQAAVDILRTQIDSLTIRRDANVEAQRRINELDNLVEQNREAYNRAYQRYQDQRTFVELISGVEGNPFEVLEEAEAPRLPTSPNPWLIRILGLILGLGLGVGVAALAEFGRNGFRTLHDVTRVMGVPVLGMVNRIVTRRESRRLALQRVTIAASCLMLVGVILWVTWAWKVRPSLLDPAIIEAIEGLRSNFR